MKRRGPSRLLTILGCAFFVIYLGTQFRFFLRSPRGDRDAEPIHLFSPNKLIHQGSFGLGHRLSKLTAAHHLAKRLELHIVQVDWGHCEENFMDIFAYLFGTNRWSVSPVTNANRLDKTVLVRNDVSGYYAGQLYKNHKFPVTAPLKETWMQKLESDQQFLISLMSRFQFSSVVENFQKQHDFRSHTVIGVHIRAGNGEQDHFQQANRELNIDPLALVQGLRDEIVQLENAPDPLVFVATDTEKYIELLKNAIPFPVVAFTDQPRYESGVSYQQTTNCIENWKSSVIDMLLLSASDVLIATSRSTFTQITPSMLVWNRGGRFCEYEHPLLACFRSVNEWMFDNKRATHKIMMHLPDPEVDPVFQSAKAFLQDHTVLPADQRTFYYGRKYNKKYRQKRPFETQWTWA